MVDGVESAARNETDARYANENLEKAQEYLRSSEDLRSSEYLQIICECGRSGCGELLSITKNEYEELRSDPTHFAISIDHLLPSADRVVRQTDQFAVVEKRPGTPEDVAREEDPRS